MLASAPGAEIWFGPGFEYCSSSEGPDDRSGVLSAHINWRYLLMNRLLLLEGKYLYQAFEFALREPVPC